MIRFIFTRGSLCISRIVYNNSAIILAHYLQSCITAIMLIDIICQTRTATGNPALSVQFGSQPCSHCYYS